MTYRPYKYLFTLLFVSALVALPSVAQERRPLDLETVTSGGSRFLSDFYPAPVYGIKWLPGGYSFFASGSDYGMLQSFDAKTGKARTLLTTEQLTDLLKPYDDVEGLYPMPAYQVTPVYHYLEVELAKGVYLIDAEQRRIVGYFATGDVEVKASALSPDEHQLAVKSSDGHLYVYSLQPAGEGAKAPALVATDEPDAAVVHGETVHQNEFGIDGGLFWSPDSRRLAYYRMDQSMVAPYPIVDMMPHKAEVRPVRYPMSGEPSHHVTLLVYDLDKAGSQLLATGGDPEHFLTNVAWHPNSDKIYIAELNRGQNHMKLNSYDARTGVFIRTLFEETDEHYVEPLRPMMFVPGSRGEQFVWQSRREGYRQLYLYNTSGKLIRKITPIDGEISDVYGFDAKGEQIFFQAAYPSPMDKQIFSADLKRGKVTQLTQEGGSHDAYFSPDKAYFIDHLTSHSVPRRLTLQTSKGKTVRSLFSAPDRTARLDMPQISQGTIKAADGVTDLYYRLITPSRMEQGKKYPTIVYVYGGPHAQLVTNTPQWGASGWDLYMAQQGYVVFTVDSRGSAERGAAFEQVIHRQVGTQEMADQMKGVDFLKTLPYVDADRMGVYGWSFGGFMATNLILSHPETFKVAVAGGPVIDWSRYEVMYGERYNDSPEENPEGYKRNNLTLRAKDLKGRLLLIHGTADNVVLWQHAQSFVKAAVDARTYPDCYYYPGHLHNVIGKDRVHLNQVITRYFQDHL